MGRENSNLARGGILFVKPIYDTPGLQSLYVFSEANENYIIDPSESALKGILNVDGINISRTSHVILSSLSWEKISGLFGVLLSLVQTSHTVNFYGPPGLYRLFKNTQFLNKSVNFRVYEFDYSNYNEIGELFKIRSIPIHSFNKIDYNDNDGDSNKRSNNYNGFYLEPNKNPVTVPLKEPQNSLASFRGTNKILLDPRNAPSMCYYFETKPLTSKFDVEKAKSLGVFHSNKYKRLVQGYEVENENGEIVKPNGLYKVVPGTGFVYINCPDVSFFKSLFANPIWNQFFNKEKTLAFVYHACPKEVLNHPEYIEFMEKLTNIPSDEENAQFEKEYKEELIKLRLQKEKEEQEKKEKLLKRQKKKKTVELVVEEEPKEKVELIAESNEDESLVESNEDKSLEESKEDSVVINSDENSNNNESATLNKEFENISVNDLNGPLMTRDELGMRLDVVPPIQTRHYVITKEYSHCQPTDSKLIETFKLLVPELSPKKEDWVPVKIEDSLDQLFKSSILKNKVFQMENNTRHILTPIRARGKVSQSKEEEPNLQNVIAALRLTAKKRDELVQRLSNFNKSLPVTLEYPKIMFLGTASSIPNNYRNVSGVLVSPTENDHMLIDCGQSSVSQIELFFGRVESRKVLRNIHFIWVSHLHADHHLGIGSVVIERTKAFKEIGIDNPPPLVVVVPQVLMPWLKDFKDFCDSNVEVIGIGEKSPLVKKVCDKLSITGLTSVPVIHCHQSYGLVVTFNPNKGITPPYKITYSGDTRPSDLLIAAGKDCDLLIHEATFTDELQNDAIKKNHSTFSEALTVSKKMNAKNTILTHFSQRYPSIIRTTDSDIYTNGLIKNSYALAYDLLRFSPYQYPLLQEINYSLDRCITEHENHVDYQKRQQETKRQRSNRELHNLESQSLPELESSLILSSSSSSKSSKSSSKSSKSSKSSSSLSTPNDNNQNTGVKGTTGTSKFSLHKFKNTKRNDKINFNVYNSMSGNPLTTSIIKKKTPSNFVNQDPPNRNFTTFNNNHDNYNNQIIKSFINNNNNNLILYKKSLNLLNKIKK